MAPNMIQVSSHDISNERQEIRMTHGGGGPWGMEVVFKSSVQDGVEIAIWHPFNHEWVTVDPKALIYHGNTAKDGAKPPVPWAKDKETKDV